VTASWTFLVYLAGFNNLTPFAVKDLAEMRKVGSTDEVRVAAFVKHQDSRGARRVILQRDGVGEAPEELGDVDSGDPQTLLDFVRWAAGQAPAQRYALIVWNHGSGWQPDDLDTLYAEVRARSGDTGVSGRELAMRSTQQIAHSLFSPTVQQVLALPTPGDRGIASDDGTGHSLDTIELAKVLAKAAAELGGPLELLGMDACLMSNHEVAYQAREHVRAIVGSEDLEPGDGWPYTNILRRLADEPTLDGTGLGAVVVEEYLASYASRNDTVTQCAVDVSRLAPLTEAFEAFTTSLRAVVADRAQRREISDAHLSSVRFQGQLVDVRSLCRNLQQGDVDDAVKEAARALDTALEPVGYVVAEGHRGRTVQGAGGITVYFPSLYDHVSDYYKDLRFAAETGWDDFLHEYHEAAGRGV
jgi:hypothetical protein